jgi:hypothetical protein
MNIFWIERTFGDTNSHNNIKNYSNLPGNEIVHLRVSNRYNIGETG